MKKSILPLRKEWYSLFSFQPCIHFPCWKQLHLKNSYKSVTIILVFARQIRIRRSPRCVILIAASSGRFSASCAVLAANRSLWRSHFCGIALFYKREPSERMALSGCRKSPTDFFDSLHNASLFSPHSAPKSCRAGFLQAFDSIPEGSRPLVLPCIEEPVRFQQGFFNRKREPSLRMALF